MPSAAAGSSPSLHAQNNARRHVPAGGLVASVALCRLCGEFLSTRCEPLISFLKRITHVDEV